MAATPLSTRHASSLVALGAVLVTLATFALPQTAGALPADSAPTVIATSPAPDATGVLFGEKTVTFSEPVTTSDGSSINCSAQGDHPVELVGGPTTFAIAPGNGFEPYYSPMPGDGTCTVTIPASSVTDDDTNDPPDTMAAPFQFTFTMAAPVSQPDLWVSRNNGYTWVGDDVHNLTGEGQTVKAPIKAGKSAAFIFHFEEDGNAPWVMTIEGQGNSKGFKVAYYLNNDIYPVFTSSVTQGYGPIPPGGSMTLVVKTARSATGSRTFTMSGTSSMNDSQDVVIGKVRIK